MNILASINYKSIHGTFFSHPTLLLLVFLIPYLILFRTVRSWSAQILSHQRLLAGASLLVIGFYLFACTFYLFSSAFLEHIEPDTASIGWLFWNGRPVYHDLLTQERYSFLYGPYLYIIVGVFEGVLGPSVFSAKLPCALAAITSLVTVFGIIRCKTNVFAALYLTALVAAFELFSGASSFWVRSDPLILFAVSLGLVASTRTGVSGPVLLGFSLGLAINLKVHALVYFFPLIILSWNQKWKVLWICAGAVNAILTICIPFVVCHNLSFPNYCELLRMASGHGFSAVLFLQNLEWLAMVAVPIGLVLAHDVSRINDDKALLLKRRIKLFAPLVVAMVILLLPASKNGAGQHHLMPFLPVIAILAVSLPGQGESFLGGVQSRAGVSLAIVVVWVAACVLTAVQRGWAQVCKPAAARGQLAMQCIEDVKGIVLRYPQNVVLMGAGGDSSYPVTFSGAELVFRGMPIGVAPSALMDFRQGGFGNIELAAFVKEIESRNCGSVRWLIPRNIALFPKSDWMPGGVSPFSMADWYSLEPLFPAGFRRSFEGMYKCVEVSEFFEIYTPLDLNVSK